MVSRSVSVADPMRAQSVRALVVEAWRRAKAAYRLTTTTPKPRPEGVPEPTRGRAASGLGYRIDSEGTEYTRKGWIGGPYNRKPATNPNTRRKRRRG